MFRPAHGLGEVYRGKPGDADLHTKKADLVSYMRLRGNVGTDAYEDLRHIKPFGYA